MRAYLIGFTNILDPNGGGNTFWPKYNTTTRSMLSFDGLDILPTRSIIGDTYRDEPLAFISDLSVSAPA